MPHKKGIKGNHILQIKFYTVHSHEASYFDRIKITENWLEYDRKKIQQQTLTM